MKIGVFDSGVGGRSVANAIKKAFIDDEVIYAQDKENVPYGSKTAAELKVLVTPIIQRLEQQGCDLIVIACNTVSTTIIDHLRQSTNIPIIGVEPMIEAAAKFTKTGVIAVCATPRTLSSSRYKQLLTDYAKGLTVVEPECSDWALMIEKDAIDRAHVRQVVRDCLAKDADVIVLGCTHYHWIEKTIERIAGENVVILQPEQDAIMEISQVLARQQ